MEGLIALGEVQPESKVGGKATALGALVRARFTVPDGFVVAATEMQLDSLESAILKAFDSLGSAYVAVRSSAAQEDGHDAAWAGQLDTFLNVPRASLLDSIARCMASARSARAQAYAAQKHLMAGSVAVIVQAMIPSEVSGVCFSVRPITQDTNQLVIEAAYGLGEAVVSGEVTPDNYMVLRRPRRIVSRSIATQPKALHFSEKSRTTTWKPASDPAAQKLSDTQILEVADTAVHLEEHFGYPVDIEWAFHAGKLYILQSRPITTLR